jgi:FdhE protein
MPQKLKEALKTIEEYKKESPHYEELLDILGDILILREKYLQEMDEETFSLDERLVESKIGGGFPLVDVLGGTYDLSRPKEYFLELLEIAERRVPGETGDVARRIRDGEIDFEDLIHRSFAPDDADEDQGEEEGADSETFDLIDLFLEESLRPFLSRQAARYGSRIAAANWTEGYCPVCGKEPKIGEIRQEEGFRYLFCSQCGYEWNFRRIKCPFCGNEEHDSLAYFTVEGEERYRVDVCNVCKRYIKMVDFRELKREANLDVEDIATLHLDILANEEGYE